MIRHIKYLPVVATLFLFSCKTAQEVKHEKLPKVKDEQLMSILDSMQKQQMTYFFSKVSTKYEDSTQSNSFKTSVRLKLDSAINATITFANIPIINALLTKDSVYVTNKKDKCYSSQSLEYLKDNFGVSFTSENVEDLILGLPVGYDPGHKYDQIEEEGMYMLCSHKKREIKRIEKKDEKEIITYYGLSPDLKALNRVMIDSPEDTTMIRIDFLTREMVDYFLAPSDVLVMITTPRKVIRIELEYRKTRINEEETIYYVVPEDYEECQ